MRLRDSLGRFTGWTGSVKPPTARPAAPKAPTRLSSPDSAASTITSAYEKFTASSDPANKSNFAASKVMELLTERRVCHLIGVEFPDSQALADALAHLKDKHPEDGKSRTGTQWSRVNVIAPRIAGMLANRERELGKIVSAEYVGGGRGLDNSTADLRFHHESGERTDVSLKSTMIGGGTARNIGMGSIKGLTGVDAQEHTLAMYDEVLAQVSEKDPARGAELAKMTIGERKYAYTDEEKAIAAAVGHKVTVDIARSVHDSWPTLSGAQKKAFLEASLGIDADSSRLFVASVNDADSGVKRPTVLPPIHEIKIFYADDNPQRMKFYHNDKMILRVNVCCTNGQGLSPTCLRTYTQ
jgi:hypothetical protein